MPVHQVLIADQWKDSKGTSSFQAEAAKSMGVPGVVQCAEAADDERARSRTGLLVQAYASEATISAPGFPDHRSSRLPESLLWRDSRAVFPARP